MRLLVAPGAVLLLGALAGCSLTGTSHTAATVSHSPAPSSAPATHDPLAGPYEAVGQLPKSCDAILSDTDLTNAFGQPQVGDTAYGSYAGLPTIGRTGRVTCQYGISIDQSGKAGPPVLSVSVITYNTSTNAVKRVADDIAATEAKGAAPHLILVDGHPATVLDETTTSAASPSTAVSGTPSPAVSSAAPSPPAAGASPSPSAVTTTATGAGVTELLMADGNRTFVLTIPATKIVGDGAINALSSLMALVYKHTLPPSAKPSTSGAPKTSAKPTASAK
ncbi:MAG: hypothetical protein ACRDVE_03245 [Actinocrinis sp.]